jgi:hypothetical protein
MQQGQAAVQYCVCMIGGPSRPVRVVSDCCKYTARVCTAAFKVLGRHLSRSGIMAGQRAVDHTAPSKHWRRAGQCRAPEAPTYSSMCTGSLSFSLTCATEVIYVAMASHDLLGRWSSRGAASRCVALTIAPPELLVRHRRQAHEAADFQGRPSRSNVGRFRVRVEAKSPTSKLQQSRDTPGVCASPMNARSHIATWPMLGPFRLHSPSAEHKAT